MEFPNYILLSAYLSKVLPFVNKPLIKVLTGQRQKEIKPYIQVALNVSDEKTFERESGNLLLIHDSHAKYVVTLDEYATGNHLGIIHMNLRDYLMQTV